MTDTRACTGLTLVEPPLAATRRRSRPDRRRREEVLHDLGAVERLLDWLEAAGHTHRRLLLVGRSFVVRWR